LVHGAFLDILVLIFQEVSHLEKTYFSAIIILSLEQSDVCVFSILKMKNQLLIFLSIFILLSGAGFVYASQGTTYRLDNPEAIGPTSSQATTTLYNLTSEIGDTVVGQSESTVYRLRHGVTYEEAGGVIIDFIAIPEKRSPLVGNNDSHVTVEVRAPGSTIPLFSALVDTDLDGEYHGLLLTGISPGTYDITAKAYSHLRRKLSSVALGSGTTVDFSAVGTNPVLCGDVNLALGDNKVNSLDMTILVGQWFVNDERTDLNQDGVVNSIDMTNMVTNFNLEGDD